ncbi:riboflavin synthase [Tissierella carlieri]|uniref:Riboflavin synthase n=1 Tax=Tissierella carlieri TaxID=689904 RepID=A0ABT1SB10_9FIRM|nr:riboflavin synthase [Tissierella carlieri]MCQ4923679.1 riboflavin synthase [Tissierella carlieri]
MFTGIVEEIGKVQGIRRGEKSFTLTISGSLVLDKTFIGDSICTNGVCLTVTKINNNSFEADVMVETLRRSNLGVLKIGSYVNLERALALDKRLGGHLVSGHIDGVGEIISREKEDNATWITIKASPDILRYIIEKGSITIDGISLTVAYVDEYVFKVSIIPHTSINTTLLDKIRGDKVNLECDLIGKYVEKLLGLQKQDKVVNSRVNEDFLEINGFI